MIIIMLIIIGYNDIAIHDWFAAAELEGAEVDERAAERLVLALACWRGRAVDMCVGM